MTARTTVADLLWLRTQIAHLTSDDPTQPKRLQEWVDTAIRVRMAQRTKSKTPAHDALMGQYAATVAMWRRACENETMMHDGDVELFRERHPMPTLKAFLIGAKRIGASDVKVCPLCGSPLDEDEPKLDAIASEA